MSEDSGLARFAAGHGLTDGGHVALPTEGDLLSQGGKVKNVAHGTLLGSGEPAILAHYTYTYTSSDSDHHTEHRDFTIVVTRIPESIGFMPMLCFIGKDSEMKGVGVDLADTVRVDLDQYPELRGARCYRYRGASEVFTRRLVSPALLDWLARSAPDLGFELSDGVLCTARKGYLEDQEKLATLCADAVHLTTAIREEAEQVQEVGGAEAKAAKGRDADPRVEWALREVETPPPPDIHAAAPAFSRHVSRSPAMIWRSFCYAVAFTLVINIPGIALPIVLGASGSWVALAAIELAVVAISFIFIFRKEVRQTVRGASTEAFYRGYAEARGMKIEEPLHFSATHSEAKLPWKPDRVLTGPLPGGGEGSLCILGDGSKRADRIAVVAGPAGPIAESELEAEPQGLTTRDLDTYLEQLAGEDRAAAAGKA